MLIYKSVTSLRIVEAYAVYFLSYLEHYVIIIIVFKITF